MKPVDLEEPTSLLDQVYLGCTERSCKRNLNVVKVNKNSIEFLTSAGTIKQLLGWERSLAETVAWSYDMVVYAKKYEERHCELANKKVEHFQGLHTMFGRSSSQRR